jgi:hypothetical protein
VELRTYSIDRVEGFEKNILMHTYASMGIQAFEEYAHCFYWSDDKRLNFLYQSEFSSSQNVIDYFTENGLRRKNPDSKTQKIVAEYVFLQTQVIQAFNDHNEHFLDREVFRGDSQNLDRLTSEL